MYNNSSSALLDVIIIFRVRQMLGYDTFCAGPLLYSQFLVAYFLTTSTLWFLPRSWDAHFHHANEHEGSVWLFVSISKPLYSTSPIHVYEYWIQLHTRMHCDLYLLLRGCFFSQLICWRFGFVGGVYHTSGLVFFDFMRVWPASAFSKQSLWFSFLSQKTAYLPHLLPWSSEMGELFSVLVRLFF